MIERFHHAYTKSGKMKRATFEEVAKWVLHALKEVSVQTVVSGFTQAEMISTASEICLDSSGDEVNGNGFSLKLLIQRVTVRNLIWMVSNWISKCCKFCKYIECFFKLFFYLKIYIYFLSLNRFLNCFFLFSYFL